MNDNVNTVLIIPLEGMARVSINGYCVEKIMTATQMRQKAIEFLQAAEWTERSRNNFNDRE